MFLRAADEGPENRPALRSTSQPKGAKKLGYLRRPVRHRVIMTGSSGYEPLVRQCLN